MSRIKEKFGFIFIFMVYGYTFLIMAIVYVYRSLIEYFTIISGICATIILISIIIFMIIYEIKRKKERKNDKKQEILRLANSLTEKEKSIRIIDLDPELISKYDSYKLDHLKKMVEQQKNIFDAYLKPED